MMRYNYIKGSKILLEYNQRVNYLFQTSKDKYMTCATTTNIV